MNKYRFLSPFAVIGCFLATGCTMVPERKFEESKLQIQALQAENEQLRDVVLNVRSQNRDLTLRAVDDARRIRAQEEAVRRLERSVLAYQEERDEMAATLNEIKSAVRTRGSSTAAAPLEALDR